MPDTITGLGGYIFESCISLKKVHINEGRVNIVQGLFDGCVNLQEINIPDTVVNIYENAFYGCEKLSAIKLPNSLKVNLMKEGLILHQISLIIAKALRK